MKVLYLDAEYTCWEDDIVPFGMSKQVIQIGIVEVDLKSMVLGRQDKYYIKPAKPTEVTQYCTDLTRITPQDIKDKGRPLDEVINTIQNKYSLKKAGVITWGLENVLIRNLEQIGRYNPFKFTDLGYIFLLTYPSGNISLTKALAHQGLAFEGEAHDALVDAYNLARLHAKMIQTYRGIHENTLVSQV